MFYIYNEIGSIINTTTTEERAIAMVDGHDWTYAVKEVSDMEIKMHRYDVSVLDDNMVEKVLIQTWSFGDTGEAMEIWGLLLMVLDEDHDEFGYAIIPNFIYHEAEPYIHVAELARFNTMLIHDTVLDKIVQYHHQRPDALR